MANITWAEFEKIDMRVGTIINALPFPEAKKPAFKVQIDFGDLGTRWSSAQITDNYTLDELVGKQVVAIVNFPKKQIANFFSECLVTGFPDTDGGIILTTVDSAVPNGKRLI